MIVIIEVIMLLTPSISGGVMFSIIFPVNKDGTYSALFSRLQRFMKIIASVVLTSEILLTFIDQKFTAEALFNSKWGQTLIIGAMTSVFVYIHIMIPKKAKTTPQPASAILIPSIHSSRKNANTINDRSKSQRGKISKRFIPWLVFILLTITIALMVASSDNLF